MWLLWLLLLFVLVFCTLFFLQLGSEKSYGRPNTTAASPTIAAVTVIAAPGEKSREADFFCVLLAVEDVAATEKIGVEVGRARSHGHELRRRANGGHLLIGSQRGVGGGGERSQPLDGELIATATSFSSFSSSSSSSSCVSYAAASRLPLNRRRQHHQIRHVVLGLLFRHLRRRCRCRHHFSRRLHFRIGRRVGKGC